MTRVGLARSTAWNAATMALCEFRIPTYKRPQWLRRAILSVLGQVGADVRAVVLDDSPEREGAAVVDAVDDPRVTYVANPRPLRASANIDQAFGRRPLAGGTYLSVLDDDNWLLPTFAAANVAALAGGRHRVVLRNQQVWRQWADRAEATDQTTRGTWFAGGPVTPLELRARLFQTEGVSNGGLFWHREAASDLVVGRAVTDAGLSESCRTLQVVEPVLFAAEPLAVFSLMPVGLRARATAADRSFGRGRQYLWRAVLRQHGAAVVRLARAAAEAAGQSLDLEMRLVEALHPTARAWRAAPAATLALLAKAVAKAATTPNPLARYRVPPLPPATQAGP